MSSDLEQGRRAEKGSVWARLSLRAKQVWRTLRGRNTRMGLALSIGVGTFIGCLPLYGLHLWLCLAICVPLRLDSVAAYFAANISNPLVAPFLVFAELQVGSYLLRGVPMPLDLEGVRRLDLGDVLFDALVGSVIVGGALALLFGSLAWFLSRRPLTEERDEGSPNAAS